MASLCFLAIRQQKNVFTCLTTFINKDEQTILTNVATSTCNLSPKPHKIASFFLDKALVSFKATDTNQNKSEFYIAFPALLQDFYNNAKEPKLHLTNYSYNFTQDLDAINSYKYPEWATINRHLKNIQGQIFVTTKDGYPTKSHTNTIPQDSAPIVALIAKHSQSFFDELNKPSAGIQEAHNNFRKALIEAKLFQNPSLADTKSITTNTLNFDVVCATRPQTNSTNVMRIQCRYLSLVNDATGAVIPLHPINKQTAKVINQGFCYNAQDIFQKNKRSALTFLAQNVAQNPTAAKNISGVNINLIMLDTEPRLTITLQAGEATSLIEDKPENQPLIKLLQNKRQRIHDAAHRLNCIQDAERFIAFAAANDRRYLSQNKSLSAYGNYCIARYQKSITETTKPNTMATKPNTLFNRIKEAAFPQVKTTMLSAINSITLETINQTPKNEFEAKVFELAKEMLTDTIKQMLQNEIARKHIEEQKELEKRQRLEKDLCIQQIKTLAL